MVTLFRNCSIANGLRFCGTSGYKWLRKFVFKTRDLQKSLLCFKQCDITETKRRFGYGFNIREQCNMSCAHA